MARGKTKGAIGGTFSSAPIPKSKGSIPNNRDSQGDKRVPGTRSGNHVPNKPFKSARIPALHNKRGRRG